jgi:hypothetical protein
MCERDYRTDIYYKNINGNYVKSYYKNYRVGRINLYVEFLGHSILTVMYNSVLEVDDFPCSILMSEIM